MRTNCSHRKKTSKKTKNNKKTIISMKKIIILAVMYHVKTNKTAFDSHILYGCVD